MIKTDKTNVIVLSLNTLISAFIITLTATMMSGWSTLIVTLCYIAGGAGCALGVVMFFIGKQALLKSVFVLVCCAFVLILVFALMSRFGGLEKYPTDGEKIEHVTELIKQTGSWGMAAYVLLQVLQVVILPIPALVCYVPGSVIWGPGYATLLASLGVLLGSVICYLIGKFFGKKVVIWIAGKENTEKYVSILGKRGKVIFILMQILPFFPDDILCLVAGLTSINFPFFILTIAIIRPCVIAVYCYLGSGSLIPFSGWGIFVWIAIIVVCIVLAVLSFKYQDRFEQWLMKKVSALREKFKSRKKKQTADGVTDIQPEAPQTQDDAETSVESATKKSDTD